MSREETRLRRQESGEPDVMSGRPEYAGVLHEEHGEVHASGGVLGGRISEGSAWKWFLAWEALVALIYFPFGFPSGEPKLLGAVPWMEWPGQVPAWAVLGLSAVAAIAYGTHHYHPRARLAWWFMGIGVLLFITGDTTYKSWHQLIGQANIPFPSFIDAIYITMYPVLAIGLLLLARSRSRGSDRASLLDALIITCGLGLLSWIFLIGPNVRSSGGLLVRLTAAAYPLGDVLLLAMLAHLWSAHGLKNAAGRLLAIGTLGTLVADTVYGFAGLHPSWNWNDGNPFDLGWIVFYACWGAAALHPSMQQLSEPTRTATTRTSPRRLVLLAAASLVGPITLLVESAIGKPIDASVVASVAGVMFLLVVFRMSGLVQVHQQAVEREQVVRRAAGELVAAPGRSGIYQATIAAVREVLAQHTDVLSVSFSVRGSDGALSVVAHSGDEDASDDPFDFRDWPGWVGEELVAGRAVSCPAAASSRPANSNSSDHVVLVPLTHDGVVTAVITLTTAAEAPMDVATTLSTLAAQVALALDREDATELFHARRSEARFQTLVQHASDVILIAKADTSIVYQSPSVEHILGWAPSRLDGSRFTTILHPDDVQRASALFGGVTLGTLPSVTAEWRVRYQDGSWRQMQVVMNNLLDDPTVEGIVLTMRDVTEQKSLEDELRHQAFHDALSGLANRALFSDRLEQALVRAKRQQTAVAVLFLDVDDFKLVNDSLGHAAGDALLVAVADRLARTLRAGDTAARFGGDEFAILLENVETIDTACQLAQRVIESLQPPIDIHERQVNVRASIGIAFSKAGTEQPAELLQAADVAMYAAKAGGKNRFEIYKPALQVAVTERLERTAELQRAVEQGQFVLHYQPVVDLEAERVIGVEALVRWQRPDEGLLPPKMFIDLAEETGLIIPLGRWVLEEACRQTRQWQLSDPRLAKLNVSVNISARHFQHDELLGDVSSALARSGLDPSHLTLEITESVLVHDTEQVIARMHELKALGVSFAVDDFGTGYSSLSYLKRFPIDVIKVDKSFVDGVGAEGADSTLALAIVQLGQSLHLATVAEGIEQGDQVDGLRAMGCGYGQGFLFSHPLSAEELDEVLPTMSTQLSDHSPMVAATTTT